VSTAVYLLNRSSCKAIGGRTPYELWNRHTPSIQHLRTFGCIAHTKVNTPHQKKLDDRSRRMVFVGYEPGSKAYRVYDPSTRCVHISRDVVFDEAAAWAWSAADPAEPNDFIIEELDQQDPSVIITSRTTTEVSPTSSSGSPAPSGAASPGPSGAAASSVSGAPMAGSPATHNTPPALGSLAHPQVEFASPPGAGMEDYLDADHDDDAPLRFRRIDNVLGEAETPELAHRDLEERLLLASNTEPASFEEAMRH